MSILLPVPATGGQGIVDRLVGFKASRVVPHGRQRLRHVVRRHLLRIKIEVQLLGTLVPHGPEYPVDPLGGLLYPLLTHAARSPYRDHGVLGRLLVEMSLMAMGLVFVTHRVVHHASFPRELCTRVDHERPLGHHLIALLDTGKHHVGFS